MLHYFNPGHETAVLNGSDFYMPPLKQVTMRRDLAFLPAWYGEHEDFVLTEDELPEDFLTSIRLFSSLPESFAVRKLPSYTAQLSGHSIAFWGISPAAIHLFRKYKKDLDIPIEIQDWNPEYTSLCSRRTAAECLEYLIENVNDIPSFILPAFHNCIEDIVNTYSFPVLIKAPYSSSGRGLIWLNLPDATPYRLQSLQGLLKKQGEVSVERILDKQLDFAMQFLCDGKGNTRFEGYSVFQTDTRGNYKGNILSSQEEMQTLISSFIQPSLLEEVKHYLMCFFRDKLPFSYHGGVGVDMMIFRQEEKFFLQPCVEINMRYNMGYLALRFFEKFCNNNCKGNLMLDYYNQPGEAMNQHLKMKQDFPLLVEENQIKGGYLSLCPVTFLSHYHSWVYLT